ncbi:hypothetical protein [Patiriisocius marinus]|uniref:hypothetical protein n=1 Tax=Patiriisocius marinus TaxID=1397112 RepID=UPI00232C8C72|nr:hypothetical protein [Patiriisocius marinus]
MTINQFISFLILIISFTACKDVKDVEKVNEKSEIVSSDLIVDHFNIWVKNPTKAKERLTDIGFYAVPDSLSLIHTGQGTTGKYFYFLNGYLELIFVYHQNEFDANNALNTALDFKERVNFETNGASPFSIALQVKEYNIEKIPFEKIRYHQEWMEENESIYSAKNSKINLKEPSIFVVYPEIEATKFETISDLKNIPDEYAFARSFYKHPNGAEKVTKISITTTGTNTQTETITAINGIENISIQNGKEHLMELYFDNNIQDKTIDLRPELPLIVYL